MRFVSIPLLLAALVCQAPFAQNTVFAPQDKMLFDQYAGYIAPYKGKPAAEIVEQTAAFFLGTPYVAATLEADSAETLTVNLRQLDCFTYVENVIALSQTALSGDMRFDAFLDNLRNLRYRNGRIDDYSSRLHYTCDWVYENEKRGIFTNISQSLGGVRETKSIGFMSAHRDAYRQIKSDETMLAKIIDAENRINRRGGFFYLPKEKIAGEAMKIPHLAMIAFVTSIEGLDVTHVGFAWREEGRTTFIHASSKAMKVIVEPSSLGEYCSSQKSCAGVIVIQMAY